MEQCFSTMSGRRCCFDVSQASPCPQKQLHKRGRIRWPIHFVRCVGSMADGRWQIPPATSSGATPQQIDIERFRFPVVLCTMVYITPPTWSWTTTNPALGRRAAGAEVPIPGWHSVQPPRLQPRTGGLGSLLCKARHRDSPRTTRICLLVKASMTSLNLTKAQDGSCSARPSTSSYISSHAN